MAAVQPRTRTLRVNAASSTKSSTSPSPNLGSNATVNSGAPLLIFLRNVRMLDLDRMSDWPGISVQTFATTGTGVAGQKRRIQCVEWALFQLFRIWDPEETAAKLKPYFPPQDQIQSINLRSALLRALETAKKNGTIGRDSVIRKTMLDDCKGERVEELLAQFSNVVLKKVLQEGLNATGAHPPVAVSLALDDRGYKNDNTELSTLALAYKASLRRFLEQKEGTRARYRDFGDLLGVKERSIMRRMEAVRAKETDCSSDTLSSSTREEMKRLIRTNWSGNENWMNVLVQGDLDGPGTGLLTMPFDRVWRRVQQGRLSEIEEDSGGLLEQLDDRVRVQKERLVRWDMFRRESFGQMTPAAISPSKRAVPEKKCVKGVDLNFSAHIELQIENLNRSYDGDGGISGNVVKLTRDHAELVGGLRDELARIKGTDTSSLSFLRNRDSRRLGGSFGQYTDGGDAVSEISELEDETSCEAITLPVRTNRMKLESLRRHPAKPQMRHSEVFTQSTSTASSLSPPATRDDKDDDRLLLQGRGECPPPTDFEEIDPPSSPTQIMAERMLESMDQMSPSPVNGPKQRPILSLAQRTRLSMAGTNSPFLEDEEPELPSSNKEPTPIKLVEAESDIARDTTTDLVERTRLSMAGFEKAQKKAQFERRKSLRKSREPPRRQGSYFPKVEEESGLDDGAKGMAGRTEDLMMEEDMEEVFKSRPKIKASPVGSPISSAREW